MRLLIITEFRRNFKSLLLWSSIVCGLSLMMLAIYPAFSDNMVNLEAIFELYPEGFLDAFGLGGENSLNMSNVYGWYGVEGYLFATLIGGSYAAILASSILSKEEDDSTIEFLLSRPISRSKVLLGKTIVVITNLVVMNIILGIITLVSFAVISSEFEATTWILYIVGGLIIELIFASLSMMVSVFVTKSRKVMSISIGIVMGLYAVDIVSKLTDVFSFLKYISPYEYVSAGSIANQNEIKPLYLLFTFIIILVSGLVTWIVYSKKDITV